MTTRGFGALRPHVTRTTTRFVVSALATAMTTVGLTAVTAAPAAAAQPSTVVMTTSALSMAPSTYEKRVQRMVNRKRAARGLPLLRLASCADTTATRWSRYLAQNDAFYHQSMTNVLNYCNASYAGETLGRGTMGPRKLVKMWMNSPGHKAVLISSKPRRIGIGATPDSSGRWVVAANFIRF